MYLYQFIEAQRSKTQSVTLQLTRGEPSHKLTYQRSIQKQRHAYQRSYTQSQDERPPPAPSQSAAIAGRANQRSEHEAEDRAEEPRQAVVLLWKTCRNTDRCR